MRVLQCTAVFRADWEPVTPAMLTYIAVPLQNFRSDPHKNIRHPLMLPLVFLLSLPGMAL
jgi:hypothetical protein